MIFSSLLFLFRFLPAVLIVYYIVPPALRNLVLTFGVADWNFLLYVPDHVLYD